MAHTQAAPASSFQDINGVVHWRDAEGRLVPETLVKPIDKARDQLVREIVGKAMGLSGLLRDFKADAFGDIAAFVDLSAEQYGVTFRGTREGGKGNLTLYSYDGRYKVQRKYADLLRFDERLQAAKALIDECLHDWCDGARDELRALVNDAFQVDKTGRINTGRVLSLRRLDIKDPRWMEAMRAIGDATVSVGTASYIMVYERLGEADEWRLISMDLAGV